MSLVPSRKAPPSQELARQVMAALRPETTGHLDRSRIPWLPLVLGLINAVALIWNVALGSWIFLVSIVALGFNAWHWKMALAQRRRLPGNSSLRKAISSDLYARLLEMEQLAEVPGYSWSAERRTVGHWKKERVDDNPARIPRWKQSSREDFTLILTRDDDGQEVLVCPVGSVNAMNADYTAEQIATILRDTADHAVEFFKSTDAFTRPPLRPGGSGERMDVQAPNLDVYVVDRKAMVDSPGLPHVAQDTAVACWGPWLDATLAESQRQQDARAAREELTRQEQAARELERRQAHLGRIRDEA